MVTVSRGLKGWVLQQYWSPLQGCSHTCAPLHEQCAPWCQSILPLICFLVYHHRVVPEYQAFSPESEYLRLVSYHTVRRPQRLVMTMQMCHCCQAVSMTAATHEVSTMPSDTAFASRKVSRMFCEIKGSADGPPDGWQPSELEGRRIAREMRFACKAINQSQMQPYH